VTFDWRVVENVRDQYRWRDYDAIYASMRERGIRPLFVLMYAPAWARDLLTLCGSDCRVPPARDELGQWREMAALIAVRYPELAGIEIWNEPNEPVFWEPSPDVARYTELLVQANEAIKDVNPAMRVVTGGFSNRALSEGSHVSLSDFLEGVYANGGGESFDALGFHAYPGTIAFEEFDRTLSQVRSVAARHGDSDKPLWVTETGFTTTGSNERFRVTAEQQAAGIVELYRRLKRQPDVEAIVFNALIELPGSSGDGEKGYGVIDAGGRKKPAYCALAIEVRDLRSCP
jgi:hypothetical protein